MVDYVSVILHWNTDYAEIPRKELPNVVKKSYEPMVAALEELHEGTVCFNITGHTIEYLGREKPELIDRIKGLVKDEVVEILATGYSHPILPLLPRQRVEVQLKDHLDCLQKIFGVKPQGIWPPELAISPSVLEQILEQGIKWVAVDYEHFSLAQFFGNDINLFERRKPTVTEILSEAFWAKGLARIKAYLQAYKTLIKMNKKHVDPLQRVIVSEDKSLRAFLCSVSWTNSTQFAVGGSVPLYSLKKHVKNILKSSAKVLPLYASDIEFFGYRELGAKPSEPKAFVSFLQKLKKLGVKTLSPTQIPEDDWAADPSFICTGSWAPDKSFRLWTDSEDNKELIRRADEIYANLSSKGWNKRLMERIEPLLRIMENSDPRGWAPLPERKNEAYSAMAAIFKILEEKAS